MLKKQNQAQMNEAERKYWMDAKACGRTRFIWRKALAQILVSWLLVPPVVYAFVNKGPVFSMEFLSIWFTLLPVCLLGGYLTGKWKWQDFEKKYPE
jgi:hypothetical protein